MVCPFWDLKLLMWSYDLVYYTSFIRYLLFLFCKKSCSLFILLVPRFYVIYASSLTTFSSLNILNELYSTWTIDADCWCLIGICIIQPGLTREQNELSCRGRCPNNIPSYVDNTIPWFPCVIFCKKVSILTV